MGEEQSWTADFSPGRLVRLARKELRETLRDRRTILTLVLMPLFVYPLLGLTFQKFLLSQSTVLGGPKRPEYVIGFSSPEDADRLHPFLVSGDLERVAANLERRYRATEHKRRPPVTPDDTWWRSAD